MIVDNKTGNNPTHKKHEIYLVERFNSFFQLG